MLSGPAELATLLVFGAEMTFTPGPNTALSTALAANKDCTGRYRSAWPWPPAGVC